ncbi:unnamed protein product [Vitrella brassicaformis CCMP3155]|uniref:Oxidoreductase n=1 Tax=Vitrella brassicaformis (strain CCMP3155) TaxID=1169540 RepID=A0A0G4EBU3_VITBC|nr:unnamed protein product [Vitrella brassicaformis CCMP3155]|eukprot:CEL92767.1 unnamed protein product [Vitrella brassicaformis CCMP3155]
MDDKHDECDDGGRRSEQNGTLANEMACSHDAGDAEGGMWDEISDEDLRTCTKVLEAFSRPPPTPSPASDPPHSPHHRHTHQHVQRRLTHWRFKGLRAALAPMLQEHTAGRVLPNLKKMDVEERRQAEKRAKRERRAAKLQADRHLINSASLRYERLQKLHSLQQQPLTDTETTAPALPLIPDGVARGSSSSNAVNGGATMMMMCDVTEGGKGQGGQQEDQQGDGGEDGGEADGELYRLRACYICKAKFSTLHHFYDRLCPPCASLNWSKRHQACDLTGRTCLVTGGRVKIGFQTALKLLCAGAFVIVTTRFPHDAARRYSAESDACEWQGRLHIYGLDLRQLPHVDAFCEFIKLRHTRLDVLINNACQTVRRPVAYYRHMMEGERAHVNAQETPSPFTKLQAALEDHWSSSLRPPAASPSTPTATATSTAIARLPADGHLSAATVPAPHHDSAALSQVPLTMEDWEVRRGGGEMAVLPEGKYDVNAQQVDLRTVNSWLLKINEVETPELMEVFAINAMAPFILNAKLKPLLLKATPLHPQTHQQQHTALSHPAPPPSSLSAAMQAGQRGALPNTEGFRQYYGGSVSGRVDNEAYIVNVSAMEGKFHRYKGANHPHTNMAKAALNMMTRTAAKEYADQGIYMNAVDTGWINDENPLPKAKDIADKHHFQTPIDEVDAAARILDPVWVGLMTGDRAYGRFFKDYFPSEW